MSIAVSCQIAPSVPLESSDVEAVDADQLARVIDVNVLLWAWIAWRLVGRRIARDQRRSASLACSGRDG